MSIDRRPGQAFGGKGGESSYGFYQPTNRVLQLDSYLERRGFTIFCADNNLADLRGQRPRVRYRLGAAWHEHWFDFLAIGKNRYRKGIMVKSDSEMELALRQKHAIEKTSPDVFRFLSEIVIMSEEELSLAAVYNAEEILIERMCFEEEEYEAAVADVSQFVGAVKFHHLLAQGKSEAARRTALWAMIDRGMLVPAEPGRIRDTSLVQFVHQ